jgi:hypothetical protein
MLLTHSNPPLSLRSEWEDRCDALKLCLYRNKASAVRGDIGEQLGTAQTYFQIAGH